MADPNMLQVKYLGSTPVDVPAVDGQDGDHFEPGETKPLHRLVACGLASRTDFKILKSDEKPEAPAK